MTAKDITESLFKDIQSSLIKKAMQDYARLKCEELLLIVAEKARCKTKYKTLHGEDHTGIYIDKDSIFNVVDLEKFCS